jgi:hypothetical protein
MLTLSTSSLSALNDALIQRIGFGHESDIEYEVTAEEFLKLYFGKTTLVSFIFSYSISGKTEITCVVSRSSS